MGLMASDQQSGVGQIPADWSVTLIGEIAEVTTGSKNTQDKVPDGEFPFFVRSQTVERINSYSFDGEAVLTAGDGVGTGKVFHYINGKFDVHQRVYRISNFQAAIDGYFFYLYFSSHFYDRIMSMTAKSSVDSVRMEMITKMAIPLPPSITEQRAIATALSDVDALIAGLERLIAKKRDIKQAAMQQLLTGQTRLPGFNGEWEPRTLGDGVRFLKNGVNARAELTEMGDVKYLHYGDIHSAASVFLDADQTVMPYLPPSKAYKLDRLQDGDLVFADASEDKDGIGKAVELRGIGNKDVVAGLHTIAARFDKEVLADGFKAYLPFMPPFSQHLKRLAAGTKVYATNRSHIATVELRLPGTKEQTAIATVLSDMDADLSALESRLAKTRAIKQGMMQELLTGRTRLV